jgi:hypothetical protein
MFSELPVLLLFPIKSGVLATPFLLIHSVSKIHNQNKKVENDLASALNYKIIYW